VWGGSRDAKIKRGLIQKFSRVLRKSREQHFLVAGRNTGFIAGGQKDETLSSDGQRLLT
jgi:hypothetical protein